jgi:hypothetical protein
VQLHTPRPTARQPADSAPGQDIARALTSLKNKLPAAVIWFGRATGHWWAMADAGRRAQLLEAESPSAPTAALARLDIAGLPRPDSRGAGPHPPAGGSPGQPSIRSRVGIRQALGRDARRSPVPLSRAPQGL